MSQPSTTFPCGTPGAFAVRGLALSLQVRLPAGGVMGPLALLLVWAWRRRRSVLRRR